MSTPPIRAALHLTRWLPQCYSMEAQRSTLQAAAEQRGWEIVATYEEAVLGTRARVARPRFDAMLRHAARHDFDVLLVSTLAQLGRNAAAVVAVLGTLDAAGVVTYAERESLDPATEHGRGMLRMAASLAELDREAQRGSVIAGQTRARASGRRLGRPMVPASVEDVIRRQLADGVGKVRVAKTVGCGVGTVQRVAKAMETDAALFRMDQVTALVPPAPGGRK